MPEMVVIRSPSNAGEEGNQLSVQNSSAYALSNCDLLLTFASNDGLVPQVASTAPIAGLAALKAKRVRKPYKKICDNTYNTNPSPPSRAD